MQLVLLIDRLQRRRQARLHPTCMLTEETGRTARKKEPALDWFEPAASSLESMCSNHYVIRPAENQYIAYIQNYIV